MDWGAVGNRDVVVLGVMLCEMPRPGEEACDENTRVALVWKCRSDRGRGEMGDRFGDKDRVKTDRGGLWHWEWPPCDGKPSADILKNLPFSSNPS
jgi:hypothetical protein